MEPSDKKSAKTARLPPEGSGQTPARETVALEKLVTDAGTQVRAEISEYIVGEYLDAIGEGARFPPVVVFRGKGADVLADGFHRVRAYQQAGRSEIEADVYQGNWDDALWFALGGNRAHGQRLSGEDKQRAIEIAYRTWPEVSQVRISAQVGCSQQYVSKVRAQLKPSGPSRYNMRIDGLEFAARIVDLHLPVDTALRAIDVGGPRRHFVVQRPEVADAAPAHALARHRAQFVLRDVQPAPVFRRVAELDATNQFPCPGRLEHFVEGSLGVRVEVVAHQDDLRAVGVASFQQAGDLQRPVHLRTPRPGRRLPPTRQRFAEQEDRGRAGPFVLVVDTPGTVLRGRHRRAGFLDQLHRLLVHAHDGTIRIVGFLIQIQDLFHVRHELGIGLRRDHPVLDPPLGHPVFFSVRRMVSWLIDSTTANSTTRRASRRNDQFA